MNSCILTVGGVIDGCIARWIDADMSIRIAIVYVRLLLTSSSYRSISISHPLLPHVL